MIHKSFAGAALLAAALLLSAFSFTALSESFPDRNAVQTTLNALSKKSSLSDEEQTEKTAAEQMLALLDQVDHEKSEMDKFQAILKEAKAKDRETDKLIAQLEKSAADESDISPQRLGKQSLQKLQKMLSDIDAQIEPLQDEQSKYSDIQTGAKSFSEKAQSEMKGLIDDIDKAKNTLNSSSLQSSTMQYKYLQASLDYLNLRYSDMQFKLKNMSDVGVYAGKRVAYANSRLAILTKRQDAVTRALQAADRANTEKEASQDQKTDSKFDMATISGNAMLSDELKENQDLRDRIEQVRSQKSIYSMEERKTKIQLQRIQSIEHDINEQISSYKGTGLLAQILFSKTDLLTEPKDSDDVQKDIIGSRIGLYTISKKQDEISTPEEYIRKKFEDSAAEGETLGDKEKAAFLSLLDERQKLLSALSKERSELVNMLIELDLSNEQYNKTRDRLVNNILEQIFWIKSNSPFTMRKILRLPKQMVEELKASKPKFNAEQFHENFPRKFFWIVPLILIFVLIQKFKAKIIAKIKKINNIVKESSFTKDNQLNTPIALLLNLILSARMPCLILAAGLAVAFSGISMEERVLTQEVILAFFLKEALLTLVFVFVYNLFRDGGMAHVHFTHGYMFSAVDDLKKIFWGLSVMLVVTVPNEMKPINVPHDVIGQLIMAGTSGFLLWVYFRSFLKNRGDEKIGVFAKLLTIVNISILSALLVMTVTGYYYAAIKISNRLVETIYLVIFYNLLFSIAVRALTLAERKLAYTRAREEKKAKQKLEADKANGTAAEDAEDVALAEQDDKMPIKAIGEQTTKIAMWTIISIALVVFWLIWKDVISLFSYLDTVKLYQIKAETEKGVVMQDITLVNILISIYIAAITYVLTKNLPGLLQIVVLNRLKVSQGNSYTITTLLSYVITAGGTFMCLNALGMEWEKLQWLVAALSVGLGFGLQEIFANFISGIILLFEKPIRVGDIVTINGVSGTVLKIRIRASTLLAFNKKEIVIPNKQFITSSLTNWTLSDTLNRMEIKVTVGYSSDTTAVRQNLERIASECPYVSKDPKPFANFTDFLDSNIEYTLYVYIRKISDIYETTDWLHTEIFNEFNRLGIEFAFPQRDVQIKNLSDGLAAAAAAAKAENAAENPAASAEKPAEKPAGGRAK